MPWAASRTRRAAAPKPATRPKAVAPAGEKRPSNVIYIRCDVNDPLPIQLGQVAELEDRTKTKTAILALRLGLEELARRHGATLADS